MARSDVSPNDAEPRAPLAFMALVFLFSLPLWAVGSATGLMLLPGLPVSALQAFCPALAALVLVWHAGGSVRALLARLADFGRARLWLLAALVLPALPALVFAMRMRLAGDPLPPIATAAPTLAPMVAVFLVAAAGEELGWSAYALDPLQRHLGALGASLFLGAVWALWHFVPLAQAERGPEWIAWWTLATIAARVVMVWLYNRAGKSVSAVVLFHAMSNLAAFGAPDYYDPRIQGLTMAALALIAMRVSVRAR